MNELLALAHRGLLEHYGMTGDMIALPGEVDYNFQVIPIDAPPVMLRLYAAGTDRTAIEFESAMLSELARQSPSFPVQRLIKGLNGATLFEATSATGDVHIVRLSSWLPGTVWADARGTTQQRRATAGFLGGMLAKLDCALASIDAAAAHRRHRWDLARAGDHLVLVPAVEDANKRVVVEMILTRFRDVVLPRLHGQAQQLIHNDANDHNVLIGTNGAISGLIDFGDAVHSWRINEVAIACAYAMLGDSDPVGVAVALTASYHDQSPLSEVEASLLFDLILTRYATSICLAAQQSRDDPSNEYLSISQADIWATLQMLGRQNSQLAIMRLRAACRFDAVPTSSKITRWLEHRSERCAPVLRVGLSADRLNVLDLSRDAVTSHSLEALFDDEALAQTVPIGRYGEDRSLYTTAEFDTADPEEARTIHVGIDLFASAGTDVLAPLAGTVEDVGVETVRLGFGGMVVLRHETDDGTPFWTLFGHLSPSSVARLQIGQSVSIGDVIGQLGTPAENGGWPPHLHFQLMTELCGWSAVQIIGVVTRSDWDVWRSLFLNPNLVLALPAACAVNVARSPEWLQRERHYVLGRSLSLAYQQPLKIVRGEGVHLIDETGQRYLDMVNNVCHVGHCHPRVVAAGQRQMALLNTNSRYLHDNLVEYSRRLAATLPDSLSVVFMVNSGSEANDLALRLARAYTGQRDIITVDHVYHGNVTSVVEVSPYKFAGPGGEGQADHVWVAQMPDLYRGQWRDEDPHAAAEYAHSVQQLIEEMDQLDRRPAAFFSEGILGTGGMLTLPDGYLQHAYNYVRQVGGLCVADEVQLGFGRVGSHMWAFETQGVVPDIVTTGKPIGNGHPMAAVITRPEIANAFANGMEYFSTFGGNPVSAAIGLEVLDVIRDQRLMHNANEVGQAMMHGLRNLAQRFMMIGDVRGHGLFIGAEFVRDRQARTPHPQALAFIIESMLAQHVLLSSEGPHGNVLKIKPPITFSHDNNHEFLTKLELSLVAAQREFGA